MPYTHTAIHPLFSARSHAGLLRQQHAEMHARFGNAEKLPSPDAEKPASMDEKRAASSTTPQDTFATASSSTSPIEAVAASSAATPESSGDTMALSGTTPQKPNPVSEGADKPKETAKTPEAKNPPRSFLGALLWDVAQLGIGYLLMPFAFPIICTLTFGGMVLSHLMGLHYDPKTDRFLNPKAEIADKIRSLRKSVAKVLMSPVNMLPIPGSWKETLHTQTNRGLRYVTRLAANNEGIVSFFKVPPTFWGKVKHVLVRSLSLLALVIKNRLSRGIIGRTVAFILGFFILDKAVLNISAQDTLQNILGNGKRRPAKPEAPSVSR